MMGLLSVTYNSAGLRQIRRLGQTMPRALPGIMARAVNKTARDTKSAVAKMIRVKINVKAATLKKRLRVSKATGNYPVSTITIKGGHIPLIAFNARQSRRGVSYLLGKGGGRTTVASAFIQTMPKSGHRGVFQRLRATRFPIVELFTSADPALEIVRKNQRKIQSDAGQKLQKETLRLINLKIKKE